jgi:hypothetical protein
VYRELCGIFENIWGCFWVSFDVVGVGGGWHVLVFLGVCGGFVL